MNQAEIATRTLTESCLAGSTAYRKVEDGLYIVKQGSAYVMINVIAWGPDKAMVRCVAQLVRGVEMRETLALQLLELNAQLRFGAFAYDPVGELVLFVHTILGGETLDAQELLATVSDVALIADEYDDKIVDKYGGQRMRDLVEESAVERILAADPSAFDFGASA